MLSERRTELSIPESGCFRFCGTVKTKSPAVTPAIFRFTNLPLIAVAIGSAHPTASDSKFGGMGLPLLSSRSVMPSPSL